ncbi:Uncharacterised protein [Corynebacterium renale]|uniref:Uncharacterized protein n=1 Tax=Corynebacterium renale TaxID=1724 RepID=A0A2A9DMB6_9CORY|nr:hypothetical protein [Corynebacterium renale]PFG27743.1 hypothetical protein ATK06_0819 [Corynebacterium renale]SQG63536.1 Uncharacterised protein [Corynebacterium renale]SQI22150.1 Uncharacterised protein [Corynebacterium renale]STD00716.1 Uncharacterised protein [Corynebacterium renale]
MDRTFDPYTAHLSESVAAERTPELTVLTVPRDLNDFVEEERHGWRGMLHNLFAA